MKGAIFIKLLKKSLVLIFSLILVVGMIPGSLMTAHAADGHEHTYSEDWTYDRLYHWREATCKHSNEKNDYEMHTLVDGKCKCGLEHTHDWDASWSFTDSGHWHNCKNNPCPVYYSQDKDGWGEHTTGADGKCSVCGKAPYYVVVIDGTSEKTSYAPGEIVTITAYHYWDKQFAKWIIRILLLGFIWY